jgi:hypothetical protein
MGVVQPGELRRLEHMPLATGVIFWFIGERSISPTPSSHGPDELPSSPAG